MTFKEKLKMEHPDKVAPEYIGGCNECPHNYGYEAYCDRPCRYACFSCEKCWNREIPGTEHRHGKWPKENPHLTEHAKLKIGENVHTWESNRIEQAIKATKPIMSRKDIDALIRIDALSVMLFSIDEMHEWPIRSAPKINMPDIKKVIFNDPATIVIWADGEKTVVKCQNNEPYDPEKGLAMAITKRALGNKGNYFDQIKKWTSKCEPKEDPEWPNNAHRLLKERGVLTSDDVDKLRKGLGVDT